MAFYTPFDHTEKDTTIERLILFMSNRIAYGQTLNDILTTETRIVNEFGTEKIFLAYKAAEILLNNR